MALLALGTRAYASILERSAVVHTSLRLRHLIKKLRNKKRKAQYLEIILEPEEAQMLTYQWFQRRFPEPESWPRCAPELDAQIKEHSREVPCVLYSGSEWKSIVELGSGAESSIDLSKFLPGGFVSQSLNMFNEDDLYSLLFRIVARNAVVEQPASLTFDDIAYPEEYREEGESITALNFGAEPESESEPETAESVEGDEDDAEDS